MANNTIADFSRWYRPSPEMVTARPARHTRKRKDNILALRTGHFSRQYRGPQYDAQFHGVVGILTKTFHSSYYGRMVQHITEFMQDRGFLAIVQSCDLGGEGELEKWLHRQASQCDGLIIHPYSLSDELLTDIMDIYPSAVLMGRYLQPHKERCVYLDNKMGGSLAAKYLLDHGHRTVAMVTGPSTMEAVRDRSAGFIDTIGELPSARCTKIIESDFCIDGGAEAMDFLFGLDESISAVFFQNDDMALGALAYCQRNNIDVPKDLSIIGYDDLAACEYSYPRLTTIHQPLDAIGEAAARLLYQRIAEKPQKPWQVESLKNGTYFLPEITERDSVSHFQHDHNEIELSAREAECLTWTAKGKTSWEIAVILGIAESTVSFHLSNVCKKLSSNNRTHSVALALKQGLIELS